ncbi:MAG: plasmid pRiA4b ORF-3 family protein [Gammaproteobacteria bacterium]|nr:plasmid pRiA4b ORF-3 family protein [Gammaproteobacteria bacterium]
MATVPHSSPGVYQFRVSLKSISPMIWRRCLIRTDMTLADLHYTIQIMMGWTDYHLNEFKIHGKHYTVTNNAGMISLSGASARDVKLSDLKLRLNRRFHCRLGVRYPIGKRTALR